MRFLLIVLSVLSLTFITPRRTPFQSCSCSADDGSCSMSGDCPQGCLAYCPSNNCRIVCVGNYAGFQEMSAPITLHLKDVNSRSVAAELAKQIHAAVIFNPRQPGTTFSIDVTDEPLWNVLDTLSAGANIQIGMEDFGHLRSMRQSLVGGERIAVCFHNVTAERLAADLSFLSGREVHVASGDPGAVVDYTGKRVTFEEIVAQASEAAGVEIAIR